MEKSSMLTIQEKREAIRQACIKLNPSITAFPRFPEDSEIVKAIKVLREIVETNHVTEDLTKVAAYCVERYKEEYQTAYIRELEQKYPSRRPIRLADIILIAKKVGYNTTEEWFKVLGRVTDQWNLRNDDLSNQEPKLIDFIYDLIKEV